MVELYGTAAATAMVVCYSLEEKGPGYTLAFAASCLAAAGYAFTIGSWPFFVLETIWAAIAARRSVRRFRESCEADSKRRRN